MMTSRWEEQFRDIADEYYPGSSRVRHVNRPVDRPPVPDGEAWDAHPKRFKVAGVEREFFGVGELAKALGRRPVTIRKWEAEGVIPRATFRQPSTDPRGVRRLYSREQIEGMVRIAHEEGLMNQNVQVTIAKTQFTPRVIALFKELSNG